MKKVIKKLVTEITFKEKNDGLEDFGYLKLSYESEGAGRYFKLTDERNVRSDEISIHLEHPDDFKMIYEAAKEMWEQWSVFYAGEQNTRMKKFTFYVDGLGKELTIIAKNEKTAREKAWESLSDGERNNAACLDCIEEIDYV